MILIIILIVFSVLFIIAETSNTTVYGKWIKDNDILDYLQQKVVSEDYHLTDTNYISLYRKPIEGNEESYHLFLKHIKGPYSNRFISKIAGPTFLCKYYISSVGCVPIWTKTHKLIKQMYSSK